MREGPGLPPPAEVQALVASLDRRAFLKLARYSAALGLLPVGCGAAAPAGLAPPHDLALEVLSPRTYVTFGAATARLVGPEGGRAVVAGRIEPARSAEGWLRALPGVAPLLQQALLVLEFAPFPLIAKLRPFTRLPGEAQDAALAELMGSRFAWKRAVFSGVRGFAMLAYYSDPASRSLTGYPGPFGGPGATVDDAMRYEPGIAPLRRENP
jgi:hypothetical protein